MPKDAPNHAGYTVRERLHEDRCTTLYRALDAGTGSPVILKVLDPRRCRPSELERLRHEYEIGASLQAGRIVRPLAFQTHQGMPALVLEDWGGQPLKALLRAPLPVGEFLELAARIAGAVAELHRQGVIHKDLKPENILVDPATNEVKLTDLCVATRIPREQQAARPPQLIEGTLPYMSPEQTGRMNRVLDSRSDLYSLGVCFFQMLTGELPFEARDAPEWLHCHVARTPPPPSRLVPGIPAQLDRIVAKLLAKMADDRYQTARGLEHDLARCLEAWRADARIEAFPLGERDIPDRLQIPQKLYGREEQVASLLRAFERVTQRAAPELVLVSGYAGIGKSSLVHELQKPIVARHGLFAEGKFDQYQRDVPYSAIARAFARLLLDLLGEREDRLATWRRRLQDALGSNGRLVSGVIPEVELLMGEQPPVPDLPLGDAGNRFHLTFRRFVGAFAVRERPLTLFLDDLQWADAASLDLLRELLTCPEVGPLLVIGAYRENEVAVGHPLLLTLEGARKAGARVSDVVLEPLPRDQLSALLADALHGSREEAAPLAALVHEKTGGNPFFALQFLTALADERLLAFDERVGAFRWDEATIRAKGFTDNVVDLMVGKLRLLPARTLDALVDLACLGNAADVAVLATARDSSQQGVHEALWEAVRAGLVVRHDGAYRFLHDRVEEAAYSLLPEGERARRHLRIGRLLLASAPPDAPEAAIFDTVNQLDRGAELIASREERERVAELNLIAARRAKASTAHASALRYLAAGRALLAEDGWDSRYDLVFPLELHRAECEYLTGHLSAAEERLASLALRARDVVDAAAVTCAQVPLYTTLDRADRAVEACLEFLRRFGISWSAHPTAEEVRQEYDRMWRQLGDRPIEQLIDLPAMAEPRQRATLDVLTSSLSAALFTDDNLHCLLVYRMVNLSLEHGNGDGSCVAYLRLGMILGPRFGDYRAGFRFGKLGFDLLERLGLLRFRARGYVGFGHLVNPWTRHFREGVELVRRAFGAAREAGDLTYACYARNCLVTLLLVEGDPLAEVQREIEQAQAFVREACFGLVTDILTAQSRLVRTLRGLTPGLSSFDEGDFDEARFERHLQGNPRLAVAACWYAIRKLQGRFFAGDHAAALDAAAKAAPLLWTSTSFPEVMEFHFYRALALGARHGEVSSGEAPRLLEELVAEHARLTSWAEHCPANFENRAALVGAEIARLRQEPEEASRLYERAIRSARDNGFVHHEALAYELASGFYAARGFDLIADTYLREARAGYLRWGADGKVRELERRHPQLLEARAAAPMSTLAVPAEQLDLFSVMKASQTISGEMDIEKLAGTLLEVALEQGGARRGCLVLEREGRLCVAAEASVEAEGVAVRLLPSPELEGSGLVPPSVVQYARLVRQPVIVEDVAADAGKFSSDAYFSSHPAKSLLCLPILRQTEPIGFLYLENRDLAGAFTRERLTALSLLASQAAISVENARLLLEERRSRERSAFLAAAGALLAESLDYERTLSKLGPLFVKSLADWCVLDLVHGRELRRVAGACADPAKEPLLEQLRERYPAGRDSPHPAARCLRTGEPFCVPVLTDEGRRELSADDGHAQLVRALGSASVLAVPLLARGQVLGALTLSSATPGRYQRAELELALEVAHRAAIAIENARLYRETQRAVRMRDEFLSVASHELRTPLTSLNMSLGILQHRDRSGRRALAPDVSRWVELAARQGTRLARLIDDLLDVSRIESGRPALDLAEVDLAAVVREVVASFEPELTNARCPISVRCDGRVMGRWDASRLDQVVTNLLSNAIKFGVGQPIEISLGEEAGKARLSVRDHGLGIDPSQQARIFERYGRAVSARHYGGLGLGLYITRRIVEAHGGTIRVESSPGEGSTFVVELPLAGPRIPERA